MLMYLISPETFAKNIDFALFIIRLRKEILLKKQTDQNF